MLCAGMLFASLLLQASLVETSWLISMLITCLSIWWVITILSGGFIASFGFQVAKLGDPFNFRSCKLVSRAFGLKHAVSHIALG